MRLYGFTYLISPQSSKEEVKSLEEKISSLIQEEEGFITKISSPTKKTLAYPIKNNKVAYLAEVVFNLEPEKIKSLEKKIKSEKSILRYLLYKKELPPIKEKIKTAPRKKKEKVKLEKIEEKLEEILGE